MLIQFVSMIVLLTVEGSGITNIQTNNIYENISPESGNDDTVDTAPSSKNNLLTVPNGNTIECPSTINFQDFNKGRLAMKNKDSGQCLFMDITENLSNAVEMTNDKERSKSTYLMKDSMIIKVFPVTSDTMLEVAGKDISDFCHGYALLYGQHIKQNVSPPCYLSDWSAWGSPDANGVRSRTRYLLKLPVRDECDKYQFVKFMIDDIGIRRIKRSGRKIKIKIKDKGKKIKIKIKHRQRKQDTDGTDRSVHLPCIMSDWVAWSSPDDNGISTRTRFVISSPPNNLGECGGLEESRKDPGVKRRKIKIKVKKNKEKIKIKQKRRKRDAIWTEKTEPCFGYINL